MRKEVPYEIYPLPDYLFYTKANNQEKSKTPVELHACSDPDGRIGQSTKNATLLIKVAAEAATGKREKMYIFGEDYPTPDGTGIRDVLISTDEGKTYFGSPAQEARALFKEMAYIKKIPEILQKLKNL